jgi:pimeloyl-ACP methyl ester carboxylesterase
MKRWAHIFVRVRLVAEHESEFFWNLTLRMMLQLAQRKLGCRFPSVRRALAEMQARPILFIHGERDSYIRVDQSQLLHAAAAEPKYLWIAPGAKHNQSAVVHPKEYTARTVAFFCKHLADENVDEQEITNPASIEVA